MITSISNSQIKNIIQLIKKSKIRDDQRLFVVEGPKMFREAPQGQIKKVYVSCAFLQQEENRELLRQKGYSVDDIEVVEDRVFKSMSDTVTPQGILCVVKQNDYSLDEILKAGPNPLLLILEDLQDPGNLGTIMRTAEGAGVTCVILSRNSVDMYNPKTIRATMGSVYRVPFLYADSLTDVLGSLKKREISSYAAHLNGELDYDQADYAKGTAFLIGNEGNGLSDALTQAADTLIKIPMCGQLESLNAAVAAAVLMYEGSRQRR